MEGVAGHKQKRLPHWCAGKCCLREFGFVSSSAAELLAEARMLDRLEVLFHLLDC